MTRPDIAAPHGLREALRLAPYLLRHLWTVPVLLVLGLFAALAETAGVGLGALFLFAVLGRTDAIAEGGGLLAMAYERPARQLAAFRSGTCNHASHN